MLGFYPLPNRTPDDVFNTEQLSRRRSIRRCGGYSSNNRVDLRLGSHSIYGSGGISYAEIVTPRPFGESPFNGAAGVRGDKNPYVQIGDAFVLNPTLVIDVRYGISRINTKTSAATRRLHRLHRVRRAGNLQPLILFRRRRAERQSERLRRRQGGGSNWRSLSTGTSTRSANCRRATASRAA